VKNQAINYILCHINILILVANTSTGDMYITTSCIFNYVYIKSDCVHFNGSEQRVELHIFRHQVAR